MILRQRGLSLRAIAVELGVSPATVLRDLHAADTAEREAVLVALGGPPVPEPPQPLTVSTRRRTRPSGQRYLDLPLWRQERIFEAERLRERGGSLREIARALKISPATVLRDLRVYDNPAL